MTGEELCDRLIHSGVRSSLSLKIVQDSLQRSNSDEMYLKTRKYSDVLYFRSTAVHNKANEKENILPNEQRFNTGKSTGRVNRVSINPPRNFFVGSNNVNISNLLKLTNQALDDLEETERSKYVFIDVNSLYNITTSLILSHIIFNTKLNLIR